jgi:hypothetical protein
LVVVLVLLILLLEKSRTTTRRMRTTRTVCDGAPPYEICFFPNSPSSGINAVTMNPGMVANITQTKKC